MFLFLPNQNSSQQDVGKPLQVTYSEKALAKPNRHAKCTWVLKAKGYPYYGCALVLYGCSIKQKSTFHIRPQKNIRA